MPLHETEVAGQATKQAIEPGGDSTSGRRQGVGIGPFASQQYRILWSSGVLAQGGQWMQQLSLGWLMLELTNSPFALGLVGFARSLPLLIVTLPGGALVDRMDRAKLLLRLQVGAAATGVAMCLILALGIVEPWHLLVVAFLGNSFMGVHFPTRQSLIYGAVPRGQVGQGIALNAAGTSGAHMLGSAIAGAIIALAGIAASFIAQAAAQTAAAALSLRVTPTAAQSSRQTTVAGDVMTTLNEVRSNPSLAGLLALGSIPALLAVPYVQLLPVFARDTFGVGPQGLGAMMAATGLGAVIGSVGLAGSRARQSALVSFAALVVFALLIVGFAFTVAFWLGLAILVLAGAAQAVHHSALNTLFQMTATEEMRGRVMALYAMTWGLIPLGSLPMGALAEVYGAPTTVALQGAVTAVVAVLIAWRMPALRRL